MNRILALLAAGTALPLLVVATCVGSAGWLDAAEQRVERRFAGPIFALPTRLYARPLVLQPRTDVARAGLREYLETLGYRAVPAAAQVRSGEYAAAPDRWVVGRRAFRDAEGAEPAARLTLRVDRRGRITQLLDADGRRLERVRLEPVAIGLLAGERSEDREPVRRERIPAHLVDAILAAEDQRFFEHAGLDLRRVAGALAANLRARRIVQGGSTITQQLAKNFFLTPERTLLRKLREAVLALRLERRLDKQQILEAYLNEVYLGQEGAVAIHGVGRAARHYFGKPVEEIDLAEAALLAGILRGPSLYSPFRNPEAARERRDLVLDLLLEQGRISEAAHREARAAALRLRPQRDVPRSTAWFVDFLRPQLETRFGAEVLARDGLAVHTTLDLRLQRLAEQSVSEGVARLEARSEHLRRPEAPLQAALVALDPRSGAIRALAGGRDYGRSQFDRVTQARRQPGSVFKPVVALAALARDGGYTLASVLEDQPVEIAALEGIWTPGNHDRSFRGLVTLREALEDSLNVPMARLGQELGLRPVIATARRLGIRSPLRSVPSLALGTYEVTLLEMTRAYAVLAAGGRRATLRGTEAILARSGETLLETPAEHAFAFDPAETYLVTSALEGAVDRGTGAALRRLGYRGPVAGKTGTTDDYRDAWFIGYTPHLVVGVWVGFDDGQSLRHSGSRAALPIFADFLVAALGPRGGAPFRPPRGVTQVEVVAEAGRPAGLRCHGAPEVFLTGTEPVEGCRGWRWFFRARRPAEDEATRGRPVVLQEPGTADPRLAEDPAARRGPVASERRRRRGPAWKLWPFGR